MICEVVIVVELETYSLRRLLETLLAALYREHCLAKDARVTIEITLIED